MVHLHRHIAAACFLSFSSSVLAVPATSSSNMAGGVDNGLDSATIPSGPAGFPHGFDFRKTFNAEVVFSASTGPHDGVVSSKGGEVFASIGDSNIEKDDQGPFKQAGEFPPSNADFNQSFSYFHNLYSMHPMFNTSMQSPQYPWPAKTNPTPPEQPVKIVRISENDGIGGALKFYDANGRQRYFRGVNVLRKGDPWYPELVRWDAQYSFNDEDINFLAELNINIIRLGVMWAGVEPVRGQYNMTYIEIMKNLVQRCGEKGIYVLVEMHQDVISEKTCGEGVPLWAAQTDTSAKYSFPWPLEKPFNVGSDAVPTRQDCDKHDWPKYHGALATGKVFSNLYRNKDGLADSFANYWGLLTKEFKSFPNVIGYELMNEPWAGDIFKNPSLLIPGVADRINLQPFYDRIAKRIRAEDESAIIFFEGVTWDNFAVGFSQVPGGKEYADRSVLAHHFYYPQPNIFKFPKTLEKRESDAKRLGCGLMLTEFDMGAHMPNADLQGLLEVADNYLHSWVGWEYKPFYPITGAGESFFDVNTGEIRVRIAKLFSRTFVESVAGSVYRMKFDMETGEFLLEYKPAAVAGGATIIRLHRALHYPDGYDVVIDPPQLAMWDKSSSSSAEDHENEVVIKNLVTPPATVSSTDGFGVVVKVKIVRK